MAGEGGDAPVGDGEDEGAARFAAGEGDCAPQEVADALAVGVVAGQAAVLVVDSDEEGDEAEWSVKGGGFDGGGEFGGGPAGGGDDDGVGDGDAAGAKALDDLDGPACRRGRRLRRWCRSRRVREGESAWWCSGRTAGDCEW